MDKFYVIKNKKGLYYAEGAWTNIVDVARKYNTREDAEERVNSIITAPLSNCEVVEIPTIADLEAKLAESEKKFVIANNLRKNSDEVLLNYKTEKYGLDKIIQELRKMKLNFPEKEWYYKGFENCERQMSSHIADLTLQVKELKQQLAEKDKEIEELNHKLNIEQPCLLMNYKDMVDMLKKSQNQTAIAELNNILDTFAIFVNEEKESMVSPDGNGNLSLLEYIENRIDTLKGEK